MNSVLMAIWPVSLIMSLRITYFLILLLNFRPHLFFLFDFIASLMHGHVVLTSHHFKKENHTSALKSAETEKKKKYSNAYLEKCRHFRLFVVSYERPHGKEESAFLQRLSKKLSYK